jgi:hypothetical protein
LLPRKIRRIHFHFRLPRAIGTSFNPRWGNALQPRSIARAKFTADVRAARVGLFALE